ncbi:MAG: hypothetical protein D6734_03280 [Candidatus Schekmanbacteria bacterium]|nr:MAG: hypothetical protein D6734_03280 [Candidatus Schekmanbacteria bacterium]
MDLQAKNWLKRILYPFRKKLGEFVINEKDTIFSKAGSFIAGNKIEGDYLEFGVYSGQSFSLAYNLIRNSFLESFTPSIWNSEEDCEERKKLWNKMKFIAFDSFEGLPTPKGIDKLSADFKEGKYSNTKENFLKNIKASGVPLDKVKVVEGWFEDTLTDETREKENIKSASIVHIDSDLYESAVLVLKFIKPLLRDGTIIIFDDWFTFRGNPALGEQRAFFEWLKENQDWTATQYQKEGVWRNSFIMNKKTNRKF